MPTYAYACTACDHTFEVQQSFSDSSLTECPECSGRLRKLFNAVGIVFKGSGFYRTDSRGTKGSSTVGSTPAKSSSDGTSSSSSSSATGSSTSASSSTGSSSSSAAKPASSSGSAA